MVRKPDVLDAVMALVEKWGDGEKDVANIMGGLEIGLVLARDYPDIASRFLEASFNDPDLRPGHGSRATEIVRLLAEFVETAGV